MHGRLTIRPVAIVGKPGDTGTVNVIVENGSLRICSSGRCFRDISVELFGTATADGVGDTNEKQSDGNEASYRKNACYLGNIMKKPKRLFRLTR